MPLRPDELRAHGSARVVVRTTDGAFTGRLDTTRLTGSSVLVLLYEEDGTADEALALDIDSILEVSRADA